MARPSTVDSDEVIAYVRAGNIPADAARHFGISRMRVSQIIAEKAPELSHASRTPEAEPKLDREQKALIRQTQAALKKANTRVEAARLLKITVSGLNSRIRRYGIEDTLTRRHRDERLYAATVKALKKHRTDKHKAAESLGLSLSGLNSRIERWGIVEPV